MSVGGLEDLRCQRIMEYVEVILCGIKFEVSQDM